MFRGPYKLCVCTAREAKKTQENKGKRTKKDRPTKAKREEGGVCDKTQQHKGKDKGRKQQQDKDRHKLKWGGRGGVPREENR